MAGDDSTRLMCENYFLLEKLFLRMAMDFHIVVLDEHLSQYPKIDWIDWKDHLSKKMMSQGDHWSRATLQGVNILDCLKKNKINVLHLVAWKPAQDTLYQVSLPDQAHVSG